MRFELSVVFYGKCSDCHEVSINPLCRACCLICDSKSRAEHVYTPREFELAKLPSVLAF